MNPVIKGRINNLVPVFNACLGELNNLVIDEKGDLALTVDTGFSGGIALPIEQIEKLGLKLVVFDTFVLATGDVIELPVFIGKVQINKEEIETWFIPGDSLLGMEFLYSAGKNLFLNFENDSVILNK